MTTAITFAEEKAQLYSPIGLRLLDELTNQAPVGKTVAFLDIRDANNTWRQTDFQPVTTISGVISYPGLERHADVTGLQRRRYRVRIVAEFYVPLYRGNSEGIEFDAFPNNDTHPPQQVVRLAQDTFLTPAPNYPFPGHISVLRGVVTDPADEPVPDAVVTQGVRERVVTDAAGTFALPLRWARQNVQIPVDAADNRTGRLGTINVQLPDALKKSQTIQIR